MSHILSAVEQPHCHLSEIEADQARAATDDVQQQHCVSFANC